MVGAALVTIVLPSATPAGTSPLQDPPLTFIVFWGGGEHGVPERASIFVADLNGHRIRQLTSAKNFAQSPVWSPRARRIAYEQDDDVYVMDRNGKHRRRVVVGGYDPRWSPSGKWLALPAGDHGIQIASIATRRSHYLRPKVGFVLPALDWSPDGRTIAFTVEDQDLTVLHSEIYAINADGSNVRRLVSAPPGVTLDMPRWSPNGKRLLYTWHNNNHRATFLYLANADGSNPKRLIRTDADARASWSWDGHRIVYGVVDIRLLNLRTGAHRRIDLRPCRHYTCQDLDWSRTR